jgi:hypothetical protein
MWHDFALQPGQLAAADSALGPGILVHRAGDRQLDMIPLGAAAARSGSRG